MSGERLLVGSVVKLANGREDIWPGCAPHVFSIMGEVFMMYPGEDDARATYPTDSLDEILVKFGEPSERDAVEVAERTVRELVGT